MGRRGEGVAGEEQSLAGEQSRGEEETERRREGEKERRSRSGREGGLTALEAIISISLRLKGSFLS
jgi:hypothetical protein